MSSKNQTQPPPIEASPAQLPNRWPAQRKKMAWILAGVLLLVWVTLMGIHAYFFSWRYFSAPSFHESWSEQQRADLLAMDEELRHNTKLAAVPVVYEVENMGHSLVPLLNNWLGERNVASVALNYREFVAPARQALHEAIRTGRGDIFTLRGEPLAAWALRLRKPELFLELVKRGADVNREFETLVPLGTCVTRTLTIEALAAEYITERTQETALGKAQATRARLLHELQAYKPELGKPHLEASVCQAICLAVLDDYPEAAQWALHHGYTPSPQSRHQICCLLCLENEQKTLRELLKEPSMREEIIYQGQANTTLQFLFMVEKIAMRDKQELARLLLEAGTNPNLLPPPGEDSCQRSALSLALRLYMNCQQTEQAEAGALIRLLRQHDARLVPGEVLSESLTEQERATLMELISETE